MFLVKYFNQKKPLEKNYKISLIGQCETGKTQFMQKCILNLKDEIYSPTIGSNIYSKSYFLNNYNTVYNLEFFDVGGKERYKDLIKLYTEKSIFILIFYDVNIVKSYEYAKYLYENYINKDSNIIFVGNYNNDKTKLHSFNDNIYYIYINSKSNDNINTLIDTILLDIANIQER